MTKQKPLIFFPLTLSFFYPLKVYPPFTRRRRDGGIVVFNRHAHAHRNLQRKEESLIFGEIIYGVKTLFSKETRVR
jgi:hypothetical protein